MNRPYSLSEEDYYKLESVRDSLSLVQSLACETNASVSISPLLYASFFEMVREALCVVLDSAKESWPPNPELLRKIQAAQKRA